jgi:putative membrane protein
MSSRSSQAAGVAERTGEPDPLAGDPRVALAEERTLLAWVRTGLALMGFGFVVARFGLFLREMAVVHPGPQPPAGGLSVWFGSGLVVLGVLVNLVAGLQHVRRLATLERGRLFRPRPWVGLAVTLLLALIGAGMAGYLLLFHA